ncbi:MAG: hypothetical protein U0800_13085 [Isosphaeraceae bacterium]
MELSKTSLDASIDPGLERVRANRPRWTIRRIMVAVAIVACLFTLARVPYVFGIVVTTAASLWVVNDGLRRQKYALILWIACLYLIIPLLVVQARWGILQGKITSPCLEGLEGAFWASLFLTALWLLAYAANLQLAIQGGDDPLLRRMSRRAALMMPACWFALLLIFHWNHLRWIAYFIYLIVWIE